VWPAENVSRAELEIFEAIHGNITKIMQSAMNRIGAWIAWANKF